MVENSCTNTFGCKADCCRNTVMDASPEEVQRLCAIAPLSPITSQEQFSTVLQSIDGKNPNENGQIFVIGTNEGLKLFVDGLCPHNTGAPDYDCRLGGQRPKACKEYAQNDIPCLITRGDKEHL